MTDGSDESGRRGVLRGRQGVGRTGARFPRRADAAARSDEVDGTDAGRAREPEVPPLPEGTAADPLVGRTGARFASHARRERRARESNRAPLALPPGPSAAASAPPAGASSHPLPVPWPDRTPAGGAVTGEPTPDVGDPLVGRTGARFDSRARRARRQANREAAQDAAVRAQAAPVRRRVELGRGAAGGRGAIPAPRTSWSDAWWAGARSADPRGSEPGRSGPRPSGGRSDDDAPTAPMHLAELRNRVEGIEPRVSVRPYVRTRGRTHARADLRVETLVSIPSPRRPLDDPEHRVISDLCDGPRSVAEVAALMRVPLGVARILIGDMADDGTLTVHRTLDRIGPGNGPDRAVMARVLKGLRAL